MHRLVKSSFVFRPVVRRFIAGDTLQEALQNCEPLCDAGFAVTLDYLGENATSEAEALTACQSYGEIIDAISNHKHRDLMNISIKLTQCGLDQSESFAETNYRAVLERAVPANTFVRIDMEASSYTERTIEMVERVFADFKNTGTVLQSCLFRTKADVERLIKVGCRLRLVKGAYLEPASIAYPDKADVDRAYLDCMELLLVDGNYPAIATHDESIIAATKKFAQDHGVGPERFEFQMLYGIRRDLQEQLLKEGYKVRIYVPFGDQWYPYFSRRLAERPANVIFILKAMFRR